MERAGVNMESLLHWGFVEGASSELSAPAAHLPFSAGCGVGGVLKSSLLHHALRCHGDHNPAQDSPTTSLTFLSLMGSWSSLID